MAIQRFTQTVLNVTPEDAVKALLVRAAGQDAADLVIDEAKNKGVKVVANGDTTTLFIDDLPVARMRLHTAEDLPPTHRLYGTHFVLCGEVNIFVKKA